MPHADRYFSPIPAVRAIARELYQLAAAYPLVCPHGHVDPRLLALDEPFPDPASLIVIPDHYVVRMLYSQGVPMEALGIPRVDGGPTETDPRRIWQLFADHFHLFRGTPSGAWLSHEFEDVFGITEALTASSAPRIYDAIQACLLRPEFRPRALFDRFRIEVLCTTDAATDSLEWHQRIRQSGWPGVIRPTFRPDLAINLRHPNWKAEIGRLGAQTGLDITSYSVYIQALEQRRQFFKQMGATATDHAAETPFTAELSPASAEAIFQRALAGQATTDDLALFTGHMLIEMARMSVDDGLVMQLHPGSDRNHNQQVFERFGPDRGCDIPLATEYTRNLKPLLNKHGNDPTADAGALHPRRDDLLARAGAAGRPLPRRAPGPAVVVPRQRRGHDTVPVSGDRDRRHLQHCRLQRRHARLPVHPRAPRRRASGGRELPRRPGIAARHHPRRRARDDRRAHLRAR